MAVIAMTREMATLGKDVAAGLAERLGLDVVHHELVKHERQLSRRLLYRVVEELLEEGEACHLPRRSARAGRFRGAA